MCRLVYVYINYHFYPFSQYYNGSQFLYLTCDISLSPTRQFIRWIYTGNLWLCSHRINTLLMVLTHYKDSPNTSLPQHIKLTKTINFRQWQCIKYWPKHWTINTAIQLSQSNIQVVALMSFGIFCQRLLMIQWLFISGNIPYVG